MRKEGEKGKIEGRPVENNEKEEGRERIKEGKKN